MTHHARLLTIAVLAMLSLGTLAGPTAAAGPRTWYVDADGSAGSSSCDGTRSVATHIQDAVDASGPGDTILVCPGRYREQVTIATRAHRGLTLQAVRRWKAIVNPKRPDGTPIVAIRSADVRVQWLQVVAPTTGACLGASGGIVVEGAAGADIRSNLVIASPKGQTFRTICGMEQGIAIDDGSTDATVAHNIVRDFRLVGIIVHNADATVVDNSVQFWHLDTCPVASTCCVGAVASVSAACATAATPATPTVTTGIRAYQSTGTISLNAVTVAPDGGLPTVFLAEAISARSSHGIRIRSNFISTTGDGITIDASNRAKVQGNLVVGAVPLPTAGVAAALQQVGILGLGNARGVITGNRVARLNVGIILDATTSGNTVTGNDLTGNGYLDCEDDTGVTTAGAIHVQNTWTDNLGNADQPVGLCTDATISPIPAPPTS